MRGETDDRGMTAEDLANWVDAVCKIKVPIERPLNVAALGMAAFSLLMGAVLVRVFANQLKFLYSNPKIWTIISLVCFSLFV